MPPSSRRLDEPQPSPGEYRRGLTPPWGGGFTPSTDGAPAGGASARPDPYEPFATAWTAGAPVPIPEVCGSGGALRLEASVPR